MIFFEQIYRYFVELYTIRFPFLPYNLKVSLYLILFSLVFIVGPYFYIFIRRFRQKIRRRRIGKWNEKISNMLANIIVYDAEEDTKEIIDHFYTRFKKLPLRKKVVKNILIDEIIIYHKNFTGKTAEILKVLFVKLGLDQEVKRKMLSRHWEIKIDGIREASEMGLTQVAEELLKYTDDENALLRMEAQAAYIKLSSINQFQFLDRASERILEWHQLVLFEVITKNKGLKTPSFKQWLQSPNDTVVTLCLKLIDHFMQFDAIEELINLLQHRNPKVVKKSIEILGKLEAKQAEKYLFELYFDKTTDVKLDILRALGRISSDHYTEFLASRIFGDNYKIKIEALKALKLLPVKGEAIINDMYERTTAQNQAIIRHVLDGRIKE